MKMRIDEICTYAPKSGIKAGEATKDGQYMFFTSSEDESKRYTDYQYDGEGIIMGTGGNATLHYYHGKYSVSTDCIVLNPDDRVRCKYLYYFFLANMPILEAGFKGAGLKHTNKKYIGSITIPELPHYDEQDRVIEVLDKISGIINARNLEIAALDDLIKARFVEVFGSIHDNKYAKKTLPEIVQSNKNAIKRGPFGGALKKEDFVESGYLVYEQRHAIHDDFKYAKYYISEEKYQSMLGFKVVPGDLIISCSGVTLGRIAEVPVGAKEGIINQALLKLSLDENVMMNTFFIQQFRGPEIQELLFGFRRGSGIPNMPSMSEVKAVKFICPPIKLQKSYCDFVQQVDKSKAVVQKALNEAQLLFDSLMQQYFG